VSRYKNLQKNNRKGTARGQNTLERGKRTSLTYSQTQRLHKSPVFHIKTNREEKEEEEIQETYV
jgi:hypothetical protein